MHENQRVRVIALENEESASVYRFIFEGHDASNSYLNIEDPPNWQGKLFQRNSNRTTSFDGRSQMNIKLEKGEEFILAPASE